MTITVKKNQVVSVYITAICLIMCYVVFSFVKNATLFWLIDALWLLVVSTIILLDIKKINASTISKTIILISFFMRIFVILGALYGRGIVSSFLNQGDQYSFLQIAQMYYEGDFSRFLTRYPYIVNLIYHFFGPYRIMAQFINIVFWYIGFKLIYSASGKSLFGKKKLLLTCFYCALPMNVLITAGIFRESVLIFFMMLSVFYLHKWQLSGDLYHIAMSAVTAVPSILLHTGCIAMWGTIFLVYVLWDCKSMTWKKYTWKTAILFLVIIFFVPIYSFIVGRLFPGYLPATLSLEVISSRSYVPARADYIVGSGVVHSIPEFLASTIYRCINFWISPAPSFWSSPSDIIGFVADTIPWIFFMFSFIKQSRRKNSKGGIVGIILFVMFTFIYAWGTRNGGTAMRHRDVLAGPLCLIMMYDIQDELICGEKIEDNGNKIAN